MRPDRISLDEQELRTPRGQLNSLRRKTMQLMATGAPTKLLDNHDCDWHETVEKLKHWADGQHAKTGIYPDREVLKFLAKFS